MSKQNRINEYVQWAVNIADDDTHGYSQAVRWAPDYDCSSFVISALEAAGIPMKAYGATYTGNMPAALKACGFVNVFSAVNIATGEGLKYGDILLNPVTHTEIYMGDYTVGAHSSETSGKYGTPGDQTGNEISIQKYKNKNYTQVWRLAGDGKNDETLYCTYRDIAMKVIRGDYGNGQQRIIKLMNSGYNMAQINEIQQTVNLILKQGV